MILLKNFGNKNLSKYKAILNYYKMKTGKKLKNWNNFQKKRVF
jgi:hypothetical protein